MRLEELKKRTTLRCAAYGGVALALGAVYLVIDGFSSSMQAERDNVKKTVTRINNDVKTLEEQYIKAKASVDLFETLSKQNGDPERMLSRRNAKITLDRLNDRYHLGGLKLRMTPVKDLDEKRFQRETVTTEGSEVELEFKGMTDEYLLNFVDSLTKELSGYVRVNGLELIRDYPITNDTLLSISQGIYPPLVSGKLQFSWLGLRDLSKPKSDSGDAAELEAIPESDDTGNGDSLPAPTPAAAAAAEGQAPSPQDAIPLPDGMLPPPTPVEAPVEPSIVAPPAPAPEGGAP
ncbi:MAG: hypothetical protein IT567_01940 [Alphaproteobacteria bacterium]|nr:hypothetical protein [Alphaproteobacteria bacterium]